MLGHSDEEDEDSGTELSATVGVPTTDVGTDDEESDEERNGTIAGAWLAAMVGEVAGLGVDWIEEDEL